MNSLLKYQTIASSRPPRYLTMKQVDKAMMDSHVAIEQMMLDVHYGDKTQSNLYQLANRYTYSMEADNNNPNSGSNNNANTASSSNPSNTNNASESNSKSEAEAKEKEANQKESIKKSEASNKSLLKRISAMIKKIFGKIVEIFKAIFRFFGLGVDEITKAKNELESTEGAEQHAEAALNKTLEEAEKAENTQEVIGDLVKGVMSQEELDNLIKEYVDQYGKFTNKKGFVDRVKRWWKGSGNKGSDVVNVIYEMSGKEAVWFLFNEKWSKDAVDPNTLKTLSDMSKYYCDFTQVVLDLAEPSHFLTNVKNAIGSDYMAGSNKTDLEFKISKNVIDELKSKAGNNNKYIGRISPKAINKAIDVSSVNSYLSSNAQPMDIFIKQDGLAGIGPLIQHTEIEKVDNQNNGRIRITREQMLAYYKIMEGAGEFFKTNLERLEARSRNSDKVDLANHSAQIDSMLASLNVKPMFQPNAKQVIIQYHAAFVQFLLRLEQNLLTMHKEIVHVINEQTKILYRGLTVAGLGSGNGIEKNRYADDESNNVVKTNKDVSAEYTKGRHGNAMGRQEKGKKWYQKMNPFNGSKLKSNMKNKDNR